MSSTRNPLPDQGRGLGAARATAPPPPSREHRIDCRYWLWDMRYAACRADCLGRWWLSALVAWNRPDQIGIGLESAGGRQIAAIAHQDEMPAESHPCDSPVIALRSVKRGSRVAGNDTMPGRDCRVLQKNPVRRLGKFRFSALDPSLPRAGTGCGCSFWENSERLLCQEPRQGRGECRCRRALGGRSLCSGETLR